MNFYQIALATHALVAVLGIGQVLTILVLAIDARAGNDHLPATLALMRLLARIVGISLGLMLLSGIGVMIPTRGAYAQTVWFPIAFILFILLGAANGVLQGSLRRASAPASDANTRGAALARLRTLAWTMCGIVVVIVTLMAAKPF
jgi:uncharacterized membrane protein